MSTYNGMITLAEYNRRWDLIMAAFRSGYLSRAEASAAITELTCQRIKHVAPRRAQ